MICFPRVPNPCGDALASISRESQQDFFARNDWPKCFESGLCCAACVAASAHYYAFPIVAIDAVYDNWPAFLQCRRSVPPIIILAT